MVEDSRPPTSLWPRAGTPAQLRRLRDALHQALAGRVVRPVFHFGLHEESQLWFEAGLPRIERQKLALVRSFYDRGLSLSEAAGKLRREILSNAIITCDTPPEDRDTQQRFVHVHLSRDRWPSNHLDWFHENSEFLFVIGRALLRRRSEFVHAFQVAFEHWCGSQGVKSAGLHSRLVNGVAYAGFVAAAELLQSPAAQEVEVFRFPFGKEKRHPEVLLSNGETC